MSRGPAVPGHITRLESPPPGFDPGVVTPPPLPDREPPIAALALDVSGRCNLACRYCAEAATQPRRPKMSEETVDASWRFLFRGGMRQGASLRFGSGEPLLGLGALRKVVRLRDSARAASGAELPALFLTTNGTLLSEKVMDWLIASGWNVKVSLDGPEFVHDAWRVRPDGRGTFARVAASVERLARDAPERLSVTAVLCHGADPQVVFDSIAERGVRRIELVPVAHRDAAIRLQNDDIARYSEFVNHYAHLRLNWRNGEEPPTLVRFGATVARVMGYNNLRVPCGAGRSFFGVSPEGALYPCFRFIGVDSYCLGDLVEGIKAEAAATFRCGVGRSFEARDACRVCWAAPLCGGPCFACAEFFGPGDGQPLGSHCAYTLADARAAVWLVGRLREQDPERLLPFIPHDVAWE